MVFLKKNEEVLDVELWVVLNALEIVIEETSNNSYTLMTIFSDLQIAFQEIQYSISRKNRFLKKQIYHQAKVLWGTRYPVVCRWILGHSGL